MKQNHTIIIISYDKNVLKESDKIVVLDAHEVSEVGTLSELISEKGKYYEIFEMQTVA